MNRGGQRTGRIIRPGLQREQGENDPMSRTIRFTLVLFGNAGFNLQPQRYADLSTEEANRAAGINYGFHRCSQSGSTQDHIQQDPTIIVQ